MHCQLGSVKTNVRARNKTQCQIVSCSGLALCGLGDALYTVLGMGYQHAQMDVCGDEHTASRYHHLALRHVYQHLTVCGKSSNLFR